VFDDVWVVCSMARLKVEVVSLTWGGTEIKSIRGCLVRVLLAQARRSVLAAVPTSFATVN